jgi:hypothetical protein
VERNIIVCFSFVIIIIIIIIFLSSIRSIETCYGRYKTESFHLFKGLPKFLFLSTCSFKFFLYWHVNSVILKII